MSTMNFVEPRLGLEQEFFLVDKEGNLSNQADAFLQRCWDIAQTQGYYSYCFVPEFVKSIVEINTIPAHNLTELTAEYIKTLQLGLRAAQESNLRLYPLSTYPLHIMPVMRDLPDCHLQLRTVGLERFENAAKCTGTHLHLEMPAGTIDRRVGSSYNSSAEARAELLNIYNLVTALDPALIALSRACPFYEGRVSGMAMRTVHYRGSETYGWEGVYTNLQPVGGLLPYANCIEDLVEQLFHRYYIWLEAMERAGIPRQLFWDTGGELLTAGWNPVRLNRLGTLELRGMDSNYPEITLALITLVVDAVTRVRHEELTVRPQAGAKHFQLKGQLLTVPEFEYLNGELLYGAVTEGVDNTVVRTYLDSVLEFALGDGELTEALARFRNVLGEYRTTETNLLNEFAPATAQLSHDEGLRLVRHCCDQLEAQVEFLSHQSSEKALTVSMEQTFPSNCSRSDRVE
ncbi:MAG: glutamate-cysteine ligase family protein [Pleurocapsa sp. MO_192.B19]|nr:glutamate-cysteine ligase family protein [Pleurocapsa sp. MO_192.B19]